jgi:pimeloyl-ACP methyl ester carboxylesterase
VLLEQPEVDKGDISLIGHSEGAVMAPRIASKQPQDVKNVVLMGASSQTLYDLVIEKANRNLFLARNYWDYDKDGRLSLEEVIVHPEAGLTIPNASSPSGDNS